jgi:LacI family transcriptional regulator
MRVHPETARRVSAAARALGYQPNTIARSLRTRRTSTVGMMVTDLTNPLIPPTVRGVEQLLEEHGYTVLVANTDYDSDREERQYEVLRSRRVDGMILTTASRANPVITGAVASGTPVVLLHDAADDVDVPGVVADNSGGTRRAVEHLRELGHQRIAYIAGRQIRSFSVERLRAFRDALGPLLREELVVICDGFTAAHGAAAFRALLDGPHEFTAVVTASDSLAMGIYDVFAHRGIVCPDECSLVGFHDMPLVDKLPPPLTTIRVPHHQMGRQAAALLVEQLLGRNGSGPRRVTVPVELVVRGSTAPPAVRPG